MSLEAGIQCFDETPWIQEGAGRVKIAKWKWYEFQKFNSEKKKRNIRSCSKPGGKCYVFLWSIRKSEAKFAVCNFFIFFLQQKLEILCYYTHLFQILSGLVPRRGNTLSEKSSHQKPLDAVQIRGGFGAEHMQMLTATGIVSSLSGRTLLMAAGGSGPHWEHSLLCRTLVCADNSTAVSIFLYWTPCAHSSPWRFTLIYRTESSYYKKKKERKSTHLLTLILFLLISEQMVTYHNGSFIKISIF